MTFNSSFVLHVIIRGNTCTIAAAQLYISRIKKSFLPVFLTHYVSVAKTGDFQETEVVISFTMVLRLFCYYIFLVGGIGIAAINMSLVFKRTRETNGMQLQLVRAKCQ